MFWKRMASLKDNLSTQCILHFHIHAKRNGTKVHFHWWKYTVHAERFVELHSILSLEQVYSVITNATTEVVHQESYSYPTLVAVNSFEQQAEHVCKYRVTSVPLSILLVSSIRPTPKVVSHNPLSQPIYGKHYR